MKMGGIGNGGGGGNQQWVVVGGGAGEGGQGGGREGGVPIRVKERAIKASQDGNCLPVRPGKHAIKKRKLKPRRIVDKGVEQSGQTTIEVWGIFLVRVPNEVEVPDDKPGATNCPDQTQHFRNEVTSQAMIGGGIHICDSERQVRGCGAEGVCEREGVANRARRREMAGVPGRDDTPSAPVCIQHIKFG